MPAVGAVVEVDDIAPSAKFLLDTVMVRPVPGHDGATVVARSAPYAVAAAELSGKKAGTSLPGVIATRSTLGSISIRSGSPTTLPVSFL